MHAGAVVGEHPDALGGHQPQLGQLGALAALGDRADRHDLAVTVAQAELGDVLGRLGGVGRRVEVGHGEHRGVPAARGGPGAGLDGLGVLFAGLAQVRVQVDQAGQGQQTGGVDALCVTRGVRHVDEPAVDDRQVGGRPVGQLGPGDDQRIGVISCLSSPPSRWYSTLIRTATPADTWSSTREFAASAASLLISTPRFIGPGCKIAAVGFSRASRSAVSP